MFVLFVFTFVPSTFIFLSNQRELFAYGYLFFLKQSLRINETFSLIYDAMLFYLQIVSSYYEISEKVAIEHIRNAFDNKIDAKCTLHETKPFLHMDNENVCIFTHFFGCLGNILISGVNTISFSNAIWYHYVWHFFFMDLFVKTLI